MIVTDIIVKDFLSFGDVHAQLPSSGLVLITGWDEDLGRANGAGKSSLFQALAWCLYGEMPRDIKVEELIRRGQKATSVTVKFTVDGVAYTVTRKRPSSLDLTIGLEKQKGNPKFLQALIEQTVGLSYEQFLITSYFPQKGDASRFLKQNDAKAKDFLGTILNFNKTESAYKKLHIEMKDLEIALATKRAEITGAEQSVERFKSIVDMPAPAMPAKEDIVKIKSELNRLTAATVNVPDTLSLDSEIERVKSAVQKVQSSKYVLEQARQNITSLARKIEQTKASEEHYLTCPACAAELLQSNGNLVAFDEEAAQGVKDQKVAAFEEQINTHKATVAENAPLAEKESAFLSKLDEVKNKRMHARHQYELDSQSKQHYVAQMATVRTQVIGVQQAKEQKAKISEQLEQMKVLVTTKTAELQAIEKEYALVSAAKAVMSPTGAIAYSLDSVMGELNDQVGQYLDIFSHNTMTYKITSGDDKAKVTHVVSKDSSDVSVGSLSGGEERGLIISVDLGLAEVIAQRGGVSLPSVLMLDECFEGLDSVGKEKVIDALREIARDRCIVVIDHSSEFNALFDQSIKIVKKSGVSRLEVV